MAGCVDAGAEHAHLSLHRNLFAGLSGRVPAHVDVWKCLGPEYHLTAAEHTGIFRILIECSACSIQLNLVMKQILVQTSIPVSFLKEQKDFIPGKD